MPSAAATWPSPTSLIDEIAAAGSVQLDVRPVLVTRAVTVLPAGGFSSISWATLPIVAAEDKSIVLVFVPSEMMMLPVGTPWPPLSSDKGVGIRQPGFRLADAPSGFGDGAEHLAAGHIDAHQRRDVRIRLHRLLVALVQNAIGRGYKRDGVDGGAGKQVLTVELLIAQRDELRRAAELIDCTAFCSACAVWWPMY